MTIYEKIIEEKKTVIMIVGHQQITGRIVEIIGDFMVVEVQNQPITHNFNELFKRVTGYISVRISDISMFWEESQTMDVRRN